jgi:methylated-DNA-[protein]-cysteine S-methyltransferase
VDSVDGADRLLAGLRGMRPEPPPDLADRLFGNWLRVPGPAGDLYVAFTDHGISYLRTAEAMQDDDETFTEAFRQEFGRPLRRAGKPPAGLLPALRGHASARKVPVDLRSRTDFERDVLLATRRIQRGQTRPYGWLAREVERPGAVRAVATVLRANPVPVLIPCHRVVRANGQPGEYVFGVARKEELLRLENVNVDEMQELAKDNIFYLGSDTTHIVCFPTCAHARRITQPHRRGFRDVDTAVRAGYRPCKQCRPAMTESA